MASTQYQGHDLGMEALLPGAHADQADTVALIIGLNHLTTEPMIVEAGVGWGAGNSPEVAIDLVDEPVPFSSEALATIESEFPKLVHVLEQAVGAWRSPGPA